MRRAWLVGLLAILLTLIPMTAFAGTVTGVVGDKAEAVTIEQGAYLDVPVTWTYEGAVGEGRYFWIPKFVTIGAGGALVWPELVTTVGSETYTQVTVPPFTPGRGLSTEPVTANIRVYVDAGAPVTTDPDQPYEITVPYLFCYEGDKSQGEASISCTTLPSFFVIVVEPDDGGIVEIGPIQGIHIPGNRHQSGSTIPVKVDVGGQLPEGWSVTLTVYGEDDNPVAIEGSGKSGDSFRYDEEDAQYILNVSTEGWAAGGYTFTVTVYNGTEVIDDESVDVTVVVSGQGKEKGNRGGNEESSKGGNRPETSPASGGKAEPQGKATGRTR